MTMWRSLFSSPFISQRPVVRILHIEEGALSYYRKNGAVTRIEVDDLKLAELRTINGQLFWYLVDHTDAFALIPESVPEIGILRRYLSTWRGFNYDGLLRFDPEEADYLQLWPLPELQVA